MRIALCRRDVCVAQPHLDHLGRHPFLVCARREGVPQHVGSDVTVESPRSRVDDQSVQPFLSHVPATVFGEDQVVGSIRRQPMPTQDFGEFGAQWHRPSPHSLRRLHPVRARLDHHTPSHPNERILAVEVDVAPTQFIQFTTTKTGKQRRVNQWPPLRRGGLEQKLRFTRGQALGISLRHRLLLDRRNPIDQLVLVGEVEDRAQRGEDVVDRLRFAPPTTVTDRRGPQPNAKLIDHHPRDVLERSVAEERE